MTDRYLPSHEWARAEGDLVVLGLSAFAAGEVGDVIHVGLPKVGASLSVTDGQGRIVALRRIGANAVAGSWSGGPLQVTLLEVGTYTLTLRRSDGRVTTKSLTVDQDWPPVKVLTFE